jgi:hypothetical protein
MARVRNKCPTSHFQDAFVAKVKRVYQKIEEFSRESNFEFWSEQDMIDAKWPETLRLCLDIEIFPTK